jgi:hypothetical protein
MIIGRACYESPAPASSAKLVPADGPHTEPPMRCGSLTSWTPAELKELLLSLPPDRHDLSASGFVPCFNPSRRPLDLAHLGFCRMIVLLTIEIRAFQKETVQELFSGYIASA